MGGGAGGSSQEPDSGEAADAPLDVEVTDALLACAGGTDQTLAMVATSSPACAECLASGMDSGLANCCADATSCSMDSQCLSLVTCELACTSGPLCNCAGVPPPANSLSTYNLLAQCAADICAGQCPMLQHVTLADQ